MKCEIVKNKIPELIRRELQGIDRIDIIKHIKECKDCKNEYLLYLKMFYTIDLEIVKMKSYDRDVDYNSLELAWIKPSPSMYFPSTAVVYPGTCFLEGTN